MLWCLSVLNRLRCRNRFSWLPHSSDVCDVLQLFKDFEAAGSSRLRVIFLQTRRLLARPFWWRVNHKRDFCLRHRFGFQGRLFTITLLWFYFVSWSLNNLWFLERVVLSHHSYRRLRCFYLPNWLGNFVGVKLNVEYWALNCVVLFLKVNKWILKFLGFVQFFWFWPFSIMRIFRQVRSSHQTSYVILLGFCKLTIVSSSSSKMLRVTTDSWTIEVCLSTKIILATTKTHCRIISVNFLRWCMPCLINIISKWSLLGIRKHMLLLYLL